MRSSLQVGREGRLEYVVPEGRTVPHLLPECPEATAMPQVLATGYLVGLVEVACLRALEGYLEGDEITLGVHLDLTHHAPTPVGGRLRVVVQVADIKGRQLRFEVRAEDDAAVVCTGSHRRAVVSRAAFESRLP